MSSVNDMLWTRWGFFFELKMYFLWSINEIILPVHEPGLWRGESHEFPSGVFPSPCHSTGWVAQSPLPWLRKFFQSRPSPSGDLWHLAWHWLTAFLHPGEGGGSAPSPVGLCQLFAASWRRLSEWTSLFYDTRHTKSQRGKANLAIGKGIINLMGKWICHHWWEMSLPLPSSFLIYTEHKSLNFYGDMTQHWILAQAAQN